MSSSGSVCGVAALQGCDQVAFGGCAVVGQGDGQVGLVVGGGQRCRDFLTAEGFPGLVVVGTDRISDAPVGHGAVGIGLDGLSEAVDSLVVVEAVGPDEAAGRTRVARRGRMW